MGPTTHAQCTASNTAQPTLFDRCLEAHTHTRTHGANSLQSLLCSAPHSQARCVPALVSLARRAYDNRKFMLLFSELGGCYCCWRARCGHRLMCVANAECGRNRRADLVRITIASDTTEKRRRRHRQRSRQSQFALCNFHGWPKWCSLSILQRKKKSFYYYCHSAVDLIV